jgi:hypothetical protein
MKITKYDSLTTEELILLATNELNEDDELAIALCGRLMDVQDELDQYKVDYESEVDEAYSSAEERIEAFRKKIIHFVGDIYA